MSTETTFTCGGCSKSYKWKPELAGKKVRCKCGQVIEVPQAAPAEDADLYDLAPDPTPAKPPKPSNLSNPADPSNPPRVVSQPVPGAAAAAAPAAPILAYHRPSPVAAATSGPRRAANDELLNQIGSPVRDLYVPIALAILGVVLTYIHYMVMENESFTVASVYVFGTTVINLVFIFLGLLAAVKWMDLGLGPIGTAAIKIVGIAIFPGSVSLLLGNFSLGGGAFYFSLTASLLITYGLLSAFFDMDLGEAMMATSLIWVIQTFVGSMLFVALMHGFGGPMLSGIGGGGGGGSSAGTVLMSSNDSSAEQDAAKFAADSANPEARAFLKQTGASWGGLDGKTARKIVDGLYAQKAKRVLAAGLTTENGTTEAGTLVVELPDDPAQRKDLLNWVQNRMAKSVEDVEFTAREGTKFLLLEFEGTD